MPHRNHLRGKRTLARACTGTGSGRCDTLFAGVGNSVHLGSRRWRESDEDYDAIAAGIHADGVDVDTGFPVVKRPDVAGLVDAQIVILNVSTVSGKRHQGWHRRGCCHWNGAGNHV